MSKLVKVELMVDGEPVLVALAEAREMSTGSLGYYITGKATFAGVQAQVAVSAIAVGTAPSSKFHSQERLETAKAGWGL